jgi:hypothetical protein
MNWLGKSLRPLATAYADRDFGLPRQFRLYSLPTRAPNQNRALIRIFLTLLVPGSRPSHGLIHDLPGDLSELAVLVLAQRP